MKWSDVAGADDEAVAALAAAGVRTPASLARVGDPDELARRAGLDPARVSGMREAARAQMHAALESLGVRSAESLASIDVALVAEALGSEEDARAMTEAARRVAARDRARTSPPPTEPMAEPTSLPGGAPSGERPPPPAPEAAELPTAPPAASAAAEVPPPAPVASPLPDAVLLRQDRATARVRLAGAVTEGLPIVTVREGDDVEAALARAEGDAVALQEGAPFASARMGGQALPPLPIYEERAPGSEGPEEARVRVGRLKEPPAPAPQGGPSLLGRLLRRKG